jgi:hypothetical protein
LALLDGAVDLLTITLFRLSQSAVRLERIMYAGRQRYGLDVELAAVKNSFHDLVLNTFEHG